MSQRFYRGFPRHLTAVASPYSPLGIKKAGASLSRMGEGETRKGALPLLWRRHFLQVGKAAQRSALGTRPPQSLPMSDWR
ncbi:hypothetical protein [uncultured Nostoc sp.]|uniref:hypothetical protein n=1 Tax=uncultured Nostoc sp. TaxID=340711 RepID=UPI00260C90CC|nr:hypothetical protein [uncultured Nostoc sp.]